MPPAVASMPKGIVPGQVTDADISAFGAALNDMHGPLLAFCRTGTRSTTLWALSQAGHLSPQEQQDYLAEVAAEVNQMAMLITQLLTLARLDESRHPAGAPLEDVAAFFQDWQRRWQSWD